MENPEEGLVYAGVFAVLTLMAAGVVWLTTDKWVVSLIFAGGGFALFGLAVVARLIRVRFWGR